MVNINKDTGIWEKLKQVNGELNIPDRLKLP